MPTDLFAVASGLTPATLLGAVPPACRQPVEPAPAAHQDGRDLVLDLGDWRLRPGACHVLPSLSLLADRPYSVRFEASFARAGSWSPWVGTATVGPDPLPAIATAAAGVESQVDVWVTRMPIERVRVRCRLRGEPDLLRAPWLATVSVADGERPAAPAATGAVRLEVPAVSQMDAPEATRLRICSPASVTMVLRFWGVAAEREVVAAEVFHQELDRYGLWPAAVCAAARRGVLGYLLRFPDWASAAWCLARGLPIVASIRYAEGELTGAAIPETTGHLLVLTGYEGDVVLVNDPAAGVEDVRRRYRIEELARAWLDRVGVGYVFFPPGGRS